MKEKQDLGVQMRRFSRDPVSLYSYLIDQMQSPGSYRNLLCKKLKTQPRHAPNTKFLASKALVLLVLILVLLVLV